MKVDKIIVLGLSPTAKYVGKEAYILNIKCIAFDFKNGSSKYSRYFENTEVISESELLEKFKSDYLNNGKIYLLCPTSDEWVEFLSKNKNLFFDTNLRTSDSYLDGTFSLLSDKVKLKNLAISIDLNYPKSVSYISGTNNKPNLSDFDFPVFIKPSNRAGLAGIMQGKKGWYLNNIEEWISFDRHNEFRDVELLVQEVIIGPESNIKVLGTVSLNGIFSDTWIGIKYRQYPQGFGSGSLVVEDNKDNELDNIAKKLLKKTKYSGFFALETKYCEKRKKTYIIEVNTRPGLWFGATTSAQSFFVLKWCASLGFNMSIEEEQQVDHKPVVWKYIYKDLFVSLKKNRQYSSKINLPKQKLNSYAVFDKQDLKPFIFDLYSGIKKKILFLFDIIC